MDRRKLSDSRAVTPRAVSKHTRGSKSEHNVKYRFSWKYKTAITPDPDDLSTARNHSAASMSKDEQFQSHEFSFDAIWRDPETKQLFHSFLVLAQNEDPFRFYDQVSLFKATGSAKIAHSIYKTFIQERAINEVNISQQLRTTIISRYEECIERKLLFPVDLFDSAQKSIYLELKQDPFHRFISSGLFKQFVSTRDERFLESIRVPDELPSNTQVTVVGLSPRLREAAMGKVRRASLGQQSPRRLNPFVSVNPMAMYGSTEPAITDPDIYFNNLEQRKDSNTFGRADVHFFLSYTSDALQNNDVMFHRQEGSPWKEASHAQDKNFKCHVRTGPDRGFKVLRYSFVMPYAIKKVLKVLTCDNKYKFPTVQSESTNGVTIQETWKLPFPYQDREFVTCNGLFHLEKSQPQRYVLLKKSLGENVYQDDPVKALVKTTKRANMLLGGWIIERGVNDLSTKIIVSYVVQLKGFVVGDGARLVTHLAKEHYISVLRSLGLDKLNSESSPKEGSPREGDGRLMGTIKVIS